MTKQKKNLAISYNNVTFEDDEKVILYTPTSLEPVKKLREKIANFLPKHNKKIG